MEQQLRARKRRIFDIIQIGNTGDWPSRLFDVGLIVMILANLAIAIFSTFDASAPYRTLLEQVETVTVVCFTVEYILRVWTAEFLYPTRSPHRAAAKYVLSFNGVIDLLSFLPHYLPVFFPEGVVAFRMFRVVRILRLFRVNAYSDALNVIAGVIKSKRNQLLSSIFIILVLMTASSLIMYGLEHQAQPEVFRNAFSGFWWAVSTLLTVGYGDIYPITIPGRVFGTILTFLGVGMVAIPTGILSAGFVEQYTRLKSMDGCAAETDVRFIRLEAGPGHPWLGMSASALPLPPGLILAVIQRRRQTIVPRDDTVIREGDRLILGAESYQDDVGITLRELVLGQRHPWVGLPIRELDISRRALVVMVRRDGRLLDPVDELTLQAGDIVLLYTQKPVPDARQLEL